MMPKEFIKTVFIEEIGSMMVNHPYITFMVMGIGIEFLGKCWDKKLMDWFKRDRSKDDFKNAIKHIPSLKKYEPYLKSHNLYAAFRCGLVHAAAPEKLISLSSKNEYAHLVEINGRLNLKVEDFYEDFKDACEFIIHEKYPSGNKMETPFLSVPGDSFGQETFIKMHS